MMTDNIIDLGLSANKQHVFLDYAHTNIAYHLLETPNLLDLVREVLPTIALTNKDQIVVERNMQRFVGTTNLVETTDKDEIVYAKRIGRDTYSRFAKNRQPRACSSIVVVLRKDNLRYYLWTAMCGKLLPEDAYRDDSLFNRTHAIAYDEALVQIDTITESKP